MKGKEYSITKFSFASLLFSAAVIIIFSLIIYKTLAGICNYDGGLLLLGLPEVIYAGRPTGRPGGTEACGPFNKKPGPRGLFKLLA
jgi:hypothetical protein